VSTLTKIAAAGLIGLATMQSAHAGGWIADKIIKPVFGEHAAREADKVHEKLGKPLDKAAEAAAAAAAAGGSR
jgi:hypothetical protein